MPRQKVLSQDAVLIRWAKKDIDWLRSEASHRRVTTTNLVRMIVFDWLRENAQTKEPK